MFIFKVKNTSIYKPYEKNTKFYTSKKEKDEHGWGIESVKQIIVVQLSRQKSKLFIMN